MDGRAGTTQKPEPPRLFAGNSRPQQPFCRQIGEAASQI
jgi:hypothetical protein